MMKNKVQGSAPLAALIFALVFLINPTVKVVDILPDFIACFIIVKYLTYSADRAPFFEEARAAFLKLAFLSLAKLPAFMLISYSRSENVQDYDTAVLFTLVFTVIETILLYQAITNLFSALFYLGERSDASALITPFAKDRKAKRFMTPESLRTLTLVFVTVKGALCFLPETLLLTRSVDHGAYVQAFRPMKLYPYAIVLAVTIVFIFSIAYAKRACAYMRAIKREGRVVAALDSLVSGERATELEKKMKVKSIKSTLSIFVAASFFTIEFCFDNFDGANLLPHFIYGGIILFAMLSLRHHSEVHPVSFVFSGLYCAVSATAYFLQIRFIDKYGYDALVKGELAKDAYLPVIIFSFIEFVLLVLVTISVCSSMKKLVLSHTGIEPMSTRYTSIDAEYHKRRVRGILLWCTLGIVAGATKLTDVALKYYSSLTLVAVDGGIGNVVSGAIPWFNLVVLAGAVLYIGYTLYIISSLKEDIEIKYT
ncbi:MAG: hypothetical protein IJW03_03320 [Clostridia bacterium]|nr:hypothetical protein [Clostridia bacterium]